MIVILYVQVMKKKGQVTAVGRLLDLVKAKLDGNDRMPFNQTAEILQAILYDNMLPLVDRQMIAK